MIDAHVHIWDPRELSYPWLRDVPVLNRPMLPRDIDDDATVGAVFVQADCVPSQALAEARWVAAQHWPVLRGIVAAADLRTPRLADHLDRLTEVDRVVGIRHLLQGEDERGWSDDPALLEGLRTLAARNLTFDACVRWPQLDALAGLLERVPDLKVVVDHLGKPSVDDGIDSAGGRRWRASMTRLSERPLAFVKLSGLAAESADRATFERNSAAFVRTGLELFGSGRAMIGSDWPVSARVGAAEAPSSWRVRVLEVVASVGGDAHEVGHRTAERFYRLAPLN